MVMRQKTLVVADIPDPEPGPGEVLVKTLACGICGSDLHALKHAERLADVNRRSGSPFVMDPGRDVVMGHEFLRRDRRLRVGDDPETASGHSRLLSSHSAAPVRRPT